MSTPSATTPPPPLQGLLPKEKAEILRDLYKKHASELLAIEEAQQKLNAIVLGIFSAGAALLASDKMQLALREHLARWALR